MLKQILILDPSNVLKIKRYEDTVYGTTVKARWSGLTKAGRHVYT